MTHEHTFFRACRCDSEGREVLDCGCGMRWRVRRNPEGEIVEVEPTRSGGSIVNVINDHSQLDQSRFQL